MPMGCQWVSHFASHCWPFLLFCSIFVPAYLATRTHLFWSYSFFLPSKLPPLARLPYPTYFIFSLSQYAFPNKVKIHRINTYVVTSLNQYIYSITLEPKSQTSWKRQRKYFKSQETRNSTVSLCLLEMIGKLQPWHLNCMSALTRPEQWQHQ